MPIYGYHCDQCGNEFEILQSMKDEPLRVCDRCGGALRKLLYPVGISFKGSGFYTTDYKGGAKPAGDSGSGPSEGAGSESKPGDGAAKPAPAETKPAAVEAKGETKKESQKPAASGGE